MSGFEKKSFERVGEHWTEAIGIPGFPQNRFEIRHREKGGVHFIDDILIAGPSGSESVLKEMGVESPRIVLVHGSPKYDLKLEECQINGVRNIGEVLIALHESAHQAQSAETEGVSESNAFESIFEHQMSSVAVKRYLEQRGIRISVDETDLEIADTLYKRISELMRADSKNESIPYLRIQLDKLGGKERVEAFQQIQNAIHEQDATARVLTALHILSERFGIDLSAVKISVPEQHRPDRSRDSYAMFSWYDSTAFFATLDVGLASHRADVPLFTLCKRLLGDTCSFSVPEGMEDMRYQPRVFREE